MKFIDENYKDTTVKAGTYLFEKLEWVNLDDNKRPILKKRTNSDKLVAYVAITLQGVEEKVTMSIDVNDLPTLPVAFGFRTREISPVPPLNSNLISDYLEELSDQVNHSDSTPNVIVKGESGWVSYIEGMGIPTGTYSVSLIDITPKDKDSGHPYPLKSKFDDSRYFYVTYVVREGENGSDTPFKGCTFNNSMPYSLIVDDEGELDFERKLGGGYTGDAQRLAAAVRLTAPDCITEEGEFYPPDKYNILPFWLDNLQEKRMIEVQRIKSTKSEKILLAFEPYVYIGDYKNSSSTPAKSKSESAAPKKSKKAPAKSESAEPSQYLEQFLSMIDLHLETEFVPNGKYSKKGLAFAKKYLGPMKKELTTNKVSQFTDGDILLVTAKLVDENILEGESVSVASTILEKDLFGENDEEELEIPSEFGDEETEWTVGEEEVPF